MPILSIVGSVRAAHNMLSLCLYQPCMGMFAGYMMQILSPAYVVKTKQKYNRISNQQLLKPVTCLTTQTYDTLYSVILLLGFDVTVMVDWVS